MLDTIAMAEQLSGEYRSAFERADIYSAGTMKEELLDEKMMELYKRLVEAEQNNQPVEDVVGSDFELFCKNYFVREKTKFTLKTALDILFKVMCGLFIYSACLLLLDEKKSNLILFVAAFVAGAVDDVVAKRWLRPIFFRNKKTKPIIYYLIVLAVFFGFFVGILSLGHNVDAIIPTRQMFVITATYVSIYSAVRLIWQYKERGGFFGDYSEKKESKKVKKEFNKELQNKSQFNTVAQVMAGRFCRIRKRKQKRGQEYTFQDFAQLIRKEHKLVKIISCISVIIVTLILLVPAIESVIEASFKDGLISLLVLGLFEYFIWLVCFRWNVKSMRMQLSIVEDCEQNGKDIIGYLENEESEDIE